MNEIFVHKVSVKFGIFAKNHHEIIFPYEIGSALNMPPLLYSEPFAVYSPGVS